MPDWFMNITEDVSLMVDRDPNIPSSFCAKTLLNRDELIRLRDSLTKAIEYQEDRDDTVKSS